MIPHDSWARRPLSRLVRLCSLKAAAALASLGIGLVLAANFEVLLLRTVLLAQKASHLGARDPADLDWERVSPVGQSGIANDNGGQNGSGNGDADTGHTARLQFSKYFSTFTDFDAKRAPEVNDPSHAFPALGVMDPKDFPPVPFFLYDEPEMQLNELKAKPSCYGLMDPDIKFISDCRKHPWRTLNPEEAEWFIIGIPVGSSVWCGTVRLSITSKSTHHVRLKRAFRALVSHEVWKKHRGNNHLLLMFDYRFLPWSDGGSALPDDPARGEWTHREKLLQNVTVMTFENWNSNPPLCAKYSSAFSKYCTQSLYVPMPWEYWRCTVVVPYLCGHRLNATRVQKVVPSYTFEEWLARPYTFFYVDASKQDWGGSSDSTGTSVRRESFKLSDAPGAHIGHKRIAPPDHWAALSNSKFCFGMVGDTPSTHRIYELVRSMCIPVIISDLWKRVGKPFETLLAWDAFSFFIPATAFLKDSKESIAFLYTLPMAVLKQKFRSLLAAREALNWRSESLLTSTFSILSANDFCGGKRGLDLTPPIPIDNSRRQLRSGRQPTYNNSTSNSNTKNKSNTNNNTDHNLTTTNGSSNIQLSPRRASNNDNDDDDNDDDDDNNNNSNNNNKLSPFFSARRDFDATRAPEVNDPSYAWPAPVLGVADPRDLPPVPFYLYDEPEMQLNELKASPSCYGLMDPDVKFISDCRTHPWRTLNPDKAKWFIIGIPVGSSIWCGQVGSSTHQDRLEKAFLALISHEVWRKHGGKNHLLLMFDYRFLAWAENQGSNALPEDPARGEWSSRHALLKDVTVMTYENWNTNPDLCQKYSSSFNKYCSNSKYVWLPWEYWRCTVVVPYLAGHRLNDTLVQAVVPSYTFEDWLARPYTLFYLDTSNQTWASGSSGTSVRQKSFRLSDAPGAHIGGKRLPPPEHWKALSESKFCIGAVGDTPTTHRVYEIIRNMCIPVIVSDLMLRVGRPFDNYLAWDAFAFFIPQSAFLKDVKESVAFLYTLPMAVLEQKFRSLLAAREVLNWRSESMLTTTFAIASANDFCGGERGLNLTAPIPFDQKI
mmetsp:Transcript_1962/g.4237  ORF Transcript_1962/g.4237 Transcript_1962/m.4237 type:complete len:1053 (+) Transcript_1962:35-3193(+)